MDVDLEEQYSLLDNYLPIRDDDLEEMSMDKHMWSDEETKNFVGFMEDFVVNGMKVDHEQFKPGTFEKLALKMIEAFLTCTVTA
ncbi:hypothetical protein AHAS_Ahas19G0153200 [Arachis hypogaea]